MMQLCLQGQVVQVRFEDGPMRTHLTRLAGEMNPLFSRPYEDLWLCNFNLDDNILVETPSRSLDPGTYNMS